MDTAVITCHYLLTLPQFPFHSINFTSSLISSPPAIVHSKTQIPLAETLTGREFVYTIGVFFLKNRSTSLSSPFQLTGLTQHIVSALSKLIKLTYF